MFLYLFAFVYHVIFVIFYFTVYLFVKGLYAVWLRNATSQAQDTYSEKLDDLKNLKWAIGTTELPKKLDSLYDEAYHFLQVDKHGKGAEMKDSIEKLNNFIELKNIKFRETNTRKMEDGEKEVKEMVQKSIIQMKHEVDQEVLSNDILLYIIKQPLYKLYH